MIIAIVIALPVAPAPTDRIKPTVVQQVRDSWRFRMKHIVLSDSFDRAVVVANPAAVPDVEHVCYVVTLAGFFAVVVHYSEQLVLLLLLGVFVLQRHNF